ncbi:hypothetical protein [Exiguobacterium aurantiacum]|uniref:YubB ferredoxin-like domain-containing protein n=1 Tax=Exiguobacterium aurantiacum TaxID=33987 RepID=A0ABY5FSV4_9BACL|nr:hypothetical protein [Exiguobacterium aurantiacum]UTT44297.1 hypothetical protein NMQ00_07310 [Exiguobacterium aurantiacum]
METISLMFCFEQDIGTRSHAENFLELLNQFEVQLSRVGFFEPVKQSFTTEIFKEMWIEGLEDTYSFIGRLEKRQSYTNIYPRGGLSGSAGFHFAISKQQFQLEQTKWTDLFRFVCETWRPYRASIELDLDRDVFVDTDQLLNETMFWTYERDDFWFLKVREVSWINYWSHALLEHGNIETIEAFDWVAVDTGADGTYFQLTEAFDDICFVARREAARTHIGPGILLEKVIDEDLMREAERLRSSDFSFDDV